MRKPPRTATVRGGILSALRPAAFAPAAFDLVPPCENVRGSGARHAGKKGGRRGMKTAERIYF